MTIGTNIITISNFNHEIDSILINNSITNINNNNVYPEKIKFPNSSKMD